MSKSDVLSQLNYNRRKLSSYKDQLKNLEEQYDALQEFSRQCNAHIGSFDGSMARRRSRLLNVDGLLSTVKCAARYQQRMNDMLNGSEYAATVASIDQLQGSVAGELRRLSNDIQYTEDQITYLQTKVAKLQYEYNTYPERKVK